MGDGDQAVVSAPTAYVEVRPTAGAALARGRDAAEVARELVPADVARRVEVVLVEDVLELAQAPPVEAAWPYRSHLSRIRPHYNVHRATPGG